MKNNRPHIVFSGGGTGGHLFPGLAVAEQLAAMIPLARITFAGSGKPFEKEHVAQAGFEYLALPARPLPHGPREAVAFVVDNFASYVLARRFLREQHVAAVVGLGGYASAPMARAASRRGVPLVLLEQNAVPGRATRWLARHASLVCASFAQIADDLRCQCPIRITGNPIRGVGWAWPTECPRATSTQMHAGPCLPYEKQILVLGGSGGSRTLNETAPRAIYKNRHLLQGRWILHQSGEAGLKATQTLYTKLDLPATVVPFIQDMPAALAAADLALCRAGGTTLAELATAGVPAILLPYPRATDDHQAANARHFSTGGGCLMLDEREVVGQLDDQLADMLCFLLVNDELRLEMSAAMRNLSRPNAAADVAELVWSIVSSRSLLEAAH